MRVMTSYRPWLAVLVAGISSLSSVSGTAFAAGATGLPVIVRPCDVNGVQLDGPGYFVLTARPGSTTHLFALVGNKSAEKATVLISPVDAATGVYGGITASLATQRRRLVGTWLRLPTGKVTLGPNKGQVVPFTVHVPRHTPPGQYVGAITALVPAPEVRRSRGIALTVQTRLADDVVITVPGPQSWRFRPDGVTAQRRTSSRYITANIKNTGNMMLKGWSYLWLWQPGRSKPVLAAPLRLDTSLPHTTIHYPLQIARHPRPGRYTFTLKVWWNGGRAIQHGSVRIRA